MTKAQFDAIVATFTLATGYTVSPRRGESGEWIVRVDKTDGFYIEFTRSDLLPWARSVYQAHG